MQAKSRQAWPSNEDGLRCVLGRAYIAAGLSEVLWICLITFFMPTVAASLHWSASWAGLDSAEALSLICTGRFLPSRDDRGVVAAATSAVLLLCDAWFDVTSSVPGVDRSAAVLQAALAEIPIACLSAALALPPLRSRLVLRPNSEENRCPPSNSPSCPAGPA